MTDTRAEFAIGIDVGGTKISGGIVDSTGRILHKLKHKSLLQSAPLRVAEQIEGLTNQLLKSQGLTERDIIGVGIGTGGQIDYRTGHVIGAVNPTSPWVGVQLRDIVAERVNMPVIVDNDGNCAALGEMMFGAARDVRDFICIVIGTGIGGAIIQNGRIYHGKAGSAGEFGHLSIDLNGPLCRCGNRGCLELYASGTGIAQRARRRIAEGAKTSLSELAKTGLTMVRSEDVFEGATAGDPFCLELIEETGYILGCAITSLLNLFNPEKVILGGGVSTQGEILLRPIRETIKERCMPVPSSADIQCSDLGEDSCLVGAAALHWQDGQIQTKQ